jgi:hypothetical protein
VPPVTAAEREAFDLPISRVAGQDLAFIAT